MKRINTGIREHIKRTGFKLKKGDAIVSFIALAPKRDLDNSLKQ